MGGKFMGDIRAAPGGLAMNMRAARYHGPGKPLSLENVTVRPPTHGEALVRVRAAGICHTDLHFLSGVLNLGISPLTLGHEIAGEVAELGEGSAGVTVGDRVLVSYYATCGRCHWCRTDRANLCPQVAAEYGFTADGGYAEYVVVPVANLVRIPAGLDLAEAATLGCSVTTAVHAAGTIGRVRLGETVVVYGAGGVGFGLIQYCKLAGARVIAVSRSAARRAKAVELGADVVLDGRRSVAEEVRAQTWGRGGGRGVRAGGCSRHDGRGDECIATAGSAGVRRVFRGPVSLSARSNSSSGS